MPVLFTSFFQKEIFWCCQMRFLFTISRLLFFVFSKLFFNGSTAPYFVPVGGDRGACFFVYPTFFSLLSW